jgi:hypothetical protein
MPAPAQTDTWLERTIPVNVYTKEGEAVTALAAANFKARLGGKSMEVRAVNYEAGPRRIVILIDVSGSMTDSGRLKWGLQFAEDLISSASPQDSLALLTFSKEIEGSIAFDQGRPALLAEISKLRTGDWSRKGLRTTALEDAVGNGMALLKPTSLGDAICLITDGGENASQLRKPKVEALLDSVGVRVYAFLPVWDMDNRTVTPQEVEGPADLRELAAGTGGDFIVFVPLQVRYVSTPGGPPIMSDSDREELKRTAQVFYNQVAKFTGLTVRLPAPLAKARDWDLEVVDASGRRDKRLQVVYPHRLAACNP